MIVRILQSKVMKTKKPTLVGFFVDKQGCKPNSVLCDYLSVLGITAGIKRTTFNRLSVCIPDVLLCSCTR